MFEIVEILLEQFLSYLPTWSCVFIVLGIAGAIVFKKLWYMFPIQVMLATLFKTIQPYAPIKQSPIIQDMATQLILTIVTIIIPVIIYIKMEPNNLGTIHKYLYVLTILFLLIIFIIAMTLTVY